jgi:hypothetical protein
MKLINWKATWSSAYIHSVPTTFQSAEGNFMNDVQWDRKCTRNRINVDAQATGKKNLNLIWQNTFYQAT